MAARPNGNERIFSKQYWVQTVCLCSDVACSGSVVWKEDLFIGSNWDFVPLFFPQVMGRLGTVKNIIFFQKALKTCWKGDTSYGSFAGNSDVRDMWILTLEVVLDWICCSVSGEELHFWRNFYFLPNPDSVAYHSRSSASVFFRVLRRSEKYIVPPSLLLSPS